MSGATAAVGRTSGSTQRALSQVDRCAQARRQTGSVFKPFVYAAALDPSGGKPDITLARKHLSWAPKVDLQEWLGRTIEYFRSIDPHLYHNPGGARGRLPGTCM